MQKLVNGQWVETTQEQLVLGDVYRVVVGAGGWIQKTFSGTEASQPKVRQITKGAFYGRFNLQTAIELETSNDPIIAVFKKRLDYRSHVDLDFSETIEGVNYIEQSAEFTAFNAAEKIEMLKDGASNEAYII